MASYEILRIAKASVGRGYDVTIHMVDGESQRYKTFFWKSETEPTKQDMQSRLEYFLSRYIEKNKIVPENVYTQSEVSDILIKEGLLIEGEKFPDDIRR